MEILHNIIDWIRSFLNTDFGILLSTAFLVGDILGFSQLIRKKVTIHFNTILGFFVVTSILLFGIVIPILILVSSSWESFGHIILNFLALLAILSFLILLYIIKEMNPFLQPTLKKEAATIHIRNKHSFFEDELFIYLVEENFRGRPLDHRIIARIWSSSYPEIIIKEKGVGFSINYKGKTNYTIRIVAIKDCEATFEVVKR